MHRNWNLILLCLLFFPVYGKTQTSSNEIKLSELMSEGAVHLYKPPFLLTTDHSPRDTAHIAFLLINDTGRDTTIYFYEGRNDWVRLTTRKLNDPVADYVSISGRDYYDKVNYDFVYFPARPVRFLKESKYQCDIRYLGSSTQNATSKIYLLSPENYQSSIASQRKFEYVNNVITYFFVGALAFGFTFFFFLYLKSDYYVFGMYALFLFMQVLYGVIQFDVYTGIGRFFMTRFNWDDYVNEVIVFIGQAVYVHFIALWLNVKTTNKKVYHFLNGIGIFFLTYASLVWLIYTIDRHAEVLDHMFKGIRLLSVFIQIALFYTIIFKVKSPVKGYVLAGTSLVLLFGVGVVAMNQAGVFDGTEWEYFDNGSWYMIGIMLECMCFASGLGLRYFLIDQSNLRLQEENIKALHDKLSTEKEAHENEIKLAEVNQELTNQQLTALRAQMNPHFIFNALNSIQKYILMGNVDEANSYLSKFSKLQRMILSYCDENFITLDKEINMLQLYLELEQLRLTDDFSFQITWDDDIEPEELQIPPMMLQPFAENAIWHGLVPKVGEKKLNIHFTLIGSETLNCTVEDNGIGRSAAGKIKEEKLMDKTASKSKGLSLVYKRLAILEKKYGKEFSIQITDKINEDNYALGTVVELEVPVNE